MHNKKKKFIIILLLFTTIISLAACSNSIEDSLSGNGYILEGRIVDNDGEGLSNIKIKTDNGEVISKTDTQGNYKLNVPKDSSKIYLSKTQYKFTKNNFEINKDTSLNITAYPTKNSSKTRQYVQNRQKISEIIINNYNSDSQKKSIENIKDLISKNKIRFSNFSYDADSITVKFPQGGQETWFLNSKNISLSSSNNSSSDKSNYKMTSSLNNTITPNNNSALIIDSHYSENDRANISNYIAQELNNMGYRVEVISGNNVNAKVYQDLDNYGIVYIQSYSEKLSQNTILMTGKKVSNSFKLLNDELYEMYMTKNARPIAIPENNSYSSYYWGINSNFITDNFSTQNNTIIFAATGAINNENFINEIFSKGGSAVITTQGSEINSEALYSLIKNMKQHNKLSKAYNNLSQVNRQNIVISKNPDHENIYLSTKIKNKPPEITKIGGEKTSENNNIVFKVNENNNLRFSLSVNDPDNKKSELNFEANGNLSDYFNENTASFNWTPDYSDGGSYELDVSVNDRYFSDTERVIIKVIDQQKTGTIKWKTNNAGNNTSIFNSPAINDKSTAHIYSNGYILSKNNDGTNNLNLKISEKENKNFQSSIILNKDNDIYYTKDQLYAFSSDGNLKWTFSGDYYSYTQAAVDKENNIYFAGYSQGKNARLYKIEDQNYQGNDVWKNKGNLLNSSKPTAPSLSIDNKIYIADNKGYLYAFLTESDYGEAIKVWEKKISNNGFKARPIIGSDGTIYIGDLEGIFYAISPSGKLQGSIDLYNNPIENSAAFDEKGNVFIPSTNGFLYKLNPKVLKDQGNRDSNKQSLIAEFDISNESLSTPAITSSGTIYITSKDNNLYAINSENGNSVWNSPLKTNNPIYSNPKINKQGTVYFAGTDGYLYSVHTNSQKAADSPWPMFGFNKENSGLSDYNSSGNPPYIILYPKNNTPEIVNGSIEIAEYQEMQLIFAGGDPDGDDINLSLTNTNINNYNYEPSNRLFTWTPGHNDADNSPYSMEFMVEDNDGNKKYKTLEVVVNDENVAPIINNLIVNGKEVSEYDNPEFKEGTTINLTVNAEDPDGDDSLIEYQLDDNGSRVSQNFIQNGEKFNWTPSFDHLAADESQTYNLTVTVHDQTGNYFADAGENKMRLNFTVANNDRPPVITNLTSVNPSQEIGTNDFEVKENNKLTLDISGQDPDGNQVEYKISPIDGDNSLSKIKKYIDLTKAVGEEGQIVITPGFDLTGQTNPEKTYSFNIIALANGKESSKETVNVTVKNKNRPPTIENKTELKDINLNDNKVVSFIIEGSDPDAGDELSYKILDHNLPNNDYTFDQSTGEFTWETPPAGDYTLTVAANDGSMQSSKVDVLVSVKDYPPIVSVIKSYQPGEEGSSLTFDIRVSDPNGDKITDLYPSKGSEFPENEIITDYLSIKDSDNNTWELSWTPDYDQAGDYNITFIGETIDGQTGTQEVLVSIANNNIAPVLNFMSAYDQNGDEKAGPGDSKIVITEGDTINFKFGFKDYDQDDTLTIKAQSRKDDGTEEKDGNNNVIEDEIITETTKTKYEKEEYSQSDFSVVLDWKTEEGDSRADSYSIRLIIDDGGPEVAEKTFNVEVQPK